MNYEIFLDRIRMRAGLRSLEEAETVARMAITELGGLVAPDRREAIAVDLPEPLASAFVRKEEWGRFDTGEYFVRVAELEGVSVGFGMEHAQVVCQALALALTPPQRDRLRDGLPVEFGSMFDELLEAARDAAVPSTLTRGGFRRRSSLSGGRPGSSHPLADAIWDNAQADSVARSDNPHGESKISSGRHTPEGRDLATGKPKRTTR